MKQSHSFLAILASIAGLALFGFVAKAQASEIAPPGAQDVLAHGTDADLEISAQRHRSVSGPRTISRTGNVGRVGRTGISTRVGRTGHVGRVGRVGRVGYEGGRRVGHVGRYGRYGRVGYTGRYGRYGRVGYVGRVGWVPPVIVPPVVLPPGPGLIVPAVPAVPVGPTCPVCPVQACLVAIYTEPNLTGQSVETAENQPRLDQSGWQNQISSIIVKSGTWDFFPDLEYRGQPPLRLAPGSYGILEPQWTKRIGSFMCVR